MPACLLLISVSLEIKSIECRLSNLINHVSHTHHTTSKWVVCKRWKEGVDIPKGPEETSDLFSANFININNLITKKSYDIFPLFPLSQILTQDVSSLSWSSGWRLSLYLAEKWCTYSNCCYRTNPSRRRLVLLCICTARRVVIGTISSFLLYTRIRTANACMQRAHTHTLEFSLTPTHTHTHFPTHPHSHSHKNTHSLTHTHTHTHTHTLITKVTNMQLPSSLEGYSVC